MKKSVAALALLFSVLTMAGWSVKLPAQAGGAESAALDPTLFKGLRYRQLDFSRGGRSTAVAGVPTKPLTYYFGSTGGGVWKTEDGGNSWFNVSDGFFAAGSIGAIAVAAADPNVVYVGTGSACPRGNISPGIGMYGSTDAGKTWTHIGLKDAGLIGRIQVHPANHDLVYVAVLGNIFGPNPERGVYRSKNGGATWEKVLFVGNRTGAVDLSMDPNNPRVLYAAMWTAERKPWTIDSGSEESGLYKTDDGGDTWSKLSGGLPAAVVGRIGVSASAAKPERAWALVEAPDDKGGLFRTDNGGKNWQRVNSERRFLQRAWYYTHVTADTRDAETVYLMNVGFFRSTDGGRTYQAIRVPHSDNHDLWINPLDPKKMINANDGGANVSLDGGASWSDQMNQPTAEFYRVTVDHRFPYRVYGAQQDNSTASVASRPGSREFYAVGGGESGHIAVDPRNPDIVYAGSYGGTITRTDAGTGLSRSIMAYPESATGQRTADLKYRFQWNAPIRISPHDPDVIYHCSQFVHRSRDKGHSWEVISPDLSRNDASKMDYSGNPITRDNTGVEIFGTVFAFEESAKAPGLLWAGSDDGLMHISRDDGRSWKNVSPARMPAFGTVNMIDLSAHDPGRAHIAVHRYRENDFNPYIFRTSNYGESWDLLTDGRNGIPAGHFVRAVREDPDRKGLLYAGTEFGMYISFDDGGRWQPFQLNLPITPITDMVVHRKDLVVATQGRAFWILDDLSPLHQIGRETAKAVAKLFAPREAYRAPGFGATVYYYFAEIPKEPATLEFMDGAGKVLQSYTGRARQETEEAAAGEEGRPAGERALPVAAGLNRFDWNLSHSPIFRIPPRIVMWGGGGASGPKVVPGNYQVRLRVGERSETQELRILADPRNDTTDAHYREQLELANLAGEKIKELYEALLRLREVRKQAADVAQLLQKGGYGREAADAAKVLGEKLTAIEGELTQLKGEGGQDALNYPGRLDNQFVKLYSEVAGPDGRPGAGSYQRFEDLKPELARLLDRLKQVLDSELAAFNKMVGAKGAPAVVLPPAVPQK